MPTSHNFIHIAHVDQKALRSILRYEAESGKFFWLVNRGGTARAGSTAGSKDRDGYVLIRVGNKNYKAHRLAWLYTHGRWPKGDIDHIDGNPANNCLANLRDVTRAQNCVSNGMHAHNTSGVRGVGWSKSKRKWRANLTLGGKYKHLGYFENRDDAVAAHLKAATEFVGGIVRLS